MTTFIHSAASTESNHLTFGLIDYIVFVSMLIASASVGVYFGFFAKSKNTTAEYLMAEKKMKTIPIAVSLVASQISGIAIMSVPAETYAFGLNYVFNFLSIFIAVPIMNYIIIPILYENKFDNCYVYLQKRFNRLSRQLVTACFVFNVFLLLPVYMFVPSLALAQVTDINVHLINVVVCSICVFYTMLGGIKAVVWTDVLQGGIMFLSVVLVGIFGIIKTGGFEKVIEKAKEGDRLSFNFSLDPRVRLTFWNTFLNGIIQWSSHFGLNQSCVQRIVSLPSLRHAKNTMWLAGAGFFFIMTFNAFIGIVMYAYYHHCDPILAGHVDKADKMMSYFVQDIIGHLQGMPGIFVCCVFSAALSTLSASLNTNAGIVYFDYIKPFIKHTEKRANCIMKILVALMGVYCVMGGLVVEHFGSILQMILTFLGIKTGAVVGLFLLGIFAPRVNGKVAVVSFALSILTMLTIIVNGQIRIRQGLIKYEPLPTQIDGCETMNVPVFMKNITTTPATSAITTQVLRVTTSLNSNRDFSLFEISFYWYIFTGAVLVWILALPLSYIWKRDEQEKQDLKLFSPFVRKYLTIRSQVLEEGEPLKKTTVVFNNDLLLRK